MSGLTSFWLPAWLIIRRSPLLYRISLTVRGIDSHAVLPSSGDRFFITGYQRSGNSYTKKLCEKLFPDIKFSSHVHTVSSLKIARSAGIPVFVLVRDPADSVASSVVQQVARGRALKTAMKSVDEYTDYYRYLIDNFNDFHFFLFEDLRENPEVVIAKVVRVLQDIECPTVDEIRRVSQEVILGIRSHDSPPQSHGWYSPEKEKSKREILSSLLDSDEFTLANASYKELRSMISDRWGV